MRRTAIALGLAGLAGSSYWGLSSKDGIRSADTIIIATGPLTPAPPLMVVDGRVPLTVRVPGPVTGVVHEPATRLAQTSDVIVAPVPRRAPVIVADTKATENVSPDAGPILRPLAEATGSVGARVPSIVIGGSATQKGSVVGASPIAAPKNADVPGKPALAASGADAGRTLSGLPNTPAARVVVPKVATLKPAAGASKGTKDDLSRVMFQTSRAKLKVEPQRTRLALRQGAEPPLVMPKPRPAPLPRVGPSPRTSSM